MISLVVCLAGSFILGGDAGKLDQTVTVGTDGAQFFLFHPDDLKHRNGSPTGWVGYPFAVTPEFVAGNLVAFDTGGDGGFRIRLTTEDLTAREKKFAGASCDFRLKVRQERVLLDNGNHIPGDEPQRDPIREDLWVKLLNGNYRVTVYAIDSDRDPDALDQGGKRKEDSLPDYVIRFRPVGRLDSVKLVAQTSPMIAQGFELGRLRADDSWSTRYEEDTSKPLRSRYTAVKIDEVVVPGSTRDMKVTKQRYETLDAANSDGGVVAIDSETNPTFGVLSSVGGGGDLAIPEDWTLTLRGLRLVRVTKVTKDGENMTVQVAPFKRPPGVVAPKLLEPLKTAFTAYAKRDEVFRKAVRYPDFEAERVAAMTSPSALTNLLLHEVQLPEAIRRDLLVRSDAVRVQRLKDFLTNTR
jgi:hypothetical protein